MDEDWGDNSWTETDIDVCSGPATDDSDVEDW